MHGTLIDDPVIIEIAYKLKDKGLYVSEISKKLSDDTGKKITQISLWRLFKSKKEPKNKLLDSDYPSLEDISYIFNPKYQKEKNATLLQHHKTVIRRDLMLRILHKYYNKIFAYNEVKINCNDRDGDENFLDHWGYLLKYHYIEKINDIEFKFCDRVKKWHLKLR